MALGSETGFHCGGRKSANLRLFSFALSAFAFFRALFLASRSRVRKKCRCPPLQRTYRKNCWNLLDYQNTYISRYTVPLRTDAIFKLKIRFFFVDILKIQKTTDHGRCVQFSEHLVRMGPIYFIIFWIVWLSFIGLIGKIIRINMSFHSSKKMLDCKKILDSDSSTRQRKKIRKPQRTRAGHALFFRLRACAFTLALN